MNSKFLLSLFLIFLTGCGVKSRPVVPPNQAISSYIGTFTKSPQKATEKPTETSANLKNK